MRVAALTALLALAAVSAWWFGRPPEAAPVDPVVTLVDRGSDTITVHVAGAVAQPGLVSLPIGARVADAVAAAGGATVDADLAALNLAAAVGDEQQVVVPRESDGAGSVGTETDGRVRINLASATEIEQLPGVGPVLAARIVAHREAFGPFATVEDLLDVSGIGEAKLASMREAVVVP